MARGGDNNEGNPTFHEGEDLPLLFFPLSRCRFLSHACFCATNQCALKRPAIGKRKLILPARNRIEFSITSQFCHFQT